MVGTFVESVAELLQPNNPATVSQVATAICLGIRLGPSVTERDLARQIAEAEAQSTEPMNEMQRLLAKDLGVSSNGTTTRSEMCMELLRVYHDDASRFVSQPTAGFQDRFCGGPLLRFANLVPEEVKPSLLPKRDSVAAELIAVAATFGICLLPFLLLWFAVKAAWNAIF